MRDLNSFQNLVEAFRRLPSVGQKSAERMAYAILEMKDEDVDFFVSSLKEAKKKIHPCERCGIYCESSLCEICQDESRDHHTLIVVSYEKDVQAFEKIDGFRGIYHVLNGVLSAVKGVGIQDLRIDSLLERLQTEDIHEIIIATSPTIEGETTALFLAKLLEKYPIQITRLAYGLPMGGHLDYADSLTLSKAIEGRTKLKE